MEKDIIFLEENLFMGIGNHKTVYRNPRDEKQCIKILHETRDPDLEREFAYRKALGERARHMSLLTTYYGKIPTSKGDGYVFERVVDYDGKTSRTMLEVLDEAQSAAVGRSAVKKMLLQFKQAYFEEEFLVAGMDPDNFLVQRLSPEKTTVRIIDNIGCSAKLPLAYYIGWVRRKRLKKYWNRFLDILERDYAPLLTEEFRKQLALWE